MEKNTKSVIVKMPPKLADDAKQLAASQGLPLTALIRLLLTKEIKRCKK